MSNGYVKQERIVTKGKGRIRYTQRDIGAGVSASSDVDDGLVDVNNEGNDEGLRRLVGRRCFSAARETSR